MAAADLVSDAAQSPRYTYPFASAPDIIRSNQKDAYFQEKTFERLIHVLRRLRGARFAHNYTAEARVLAEMLYMGLTTLVGNRTLGEEYCDIVQVERETSTLPSVGRRGGYILASILLPYTLNRTLPVFRRKVRRALEASLRAPPGHKRPTQSKLRQLRSYILENLDTITSPSPVYAVSLAIFYFTGSYYHLGKRLFGLRYIFTNSAETSSQKIGYEVLGVLLVLQLSVQAWLHLQSTSTGTTGVANPESLAGGTAMLEGGVEVSLDPGMYTANNALLFETPHTHSPPSNVEKVTHTKVLPEGQYRYHLTDEDVMAWISGKQSRKCTLCLDEFKDPSVTTCGHVFCWNCIGDWVREKPECPLCRQQVMLQHILPLRG